MNSSIGIADYLGPGHDVRPEDAPGTQIVACFRVYAPRAQRRLKSMDVNKAAELYRSGMSLREVARHMGGYHCVSIREAFIRAGIPRRRWDPRTGGPMYRPRIATTCAWCHGEFLKRQYYARNGCGTNSNPKPGKFDIHPECRRAATRLYGRHWAWAMGQRSAEVQARIDALRTAAEGAKSGHGR
jgi:ribosomal protein L34E